MTRRVLVAAGALLLHTALPAAARAQSAGVLLAEGIAAYRDLEFVAASRLLRRALAPDVSPPLTPAERARALMYLGAAQHYAGDRSAAVATLRDLIVETPKYRPDPMAFPPEMVRVFEQARRSTKAVALEVPPLHEFPPGAGALSVRLYVSSGHHVRVAVLSESGDTLATLHDGAVPDSLALAWNGLDTLGQTPEAGRYRVEAASSVVPGDVLRAVRVPLEITRTRPRPVSPPAAPPDSMLRPETRPAARPYELALPALVGGVALAVPAAAGAGGAPGVRIGAGAALVAFGAITLLTSPAERTIPENVAFNDSTRADWRRRALEVEEANRRLADAVTLVVRAGAPERIERD